MGVETVAEAVGGLVEKSAISKSMRHIIPFMALCYFVAFLDRINVGMAAITMNKSLGLSPAVYGAAMLPPLLRQRRLQRINHIGAITRLQHLLPTLQE
jgi:hypothetical protein